MSTWSDDLATVSPGDKLYWKVVVWNTGDLDAEEVKVSDSYTSDEIYKSFENDSEVDGVLTTLDFGTVTADTTESTGVEEIFTAVIKEDLAAGSYRSENTATVVDEEDISESAAIEFTVEEELAGPAPEPEVSTPGETETGWEPGQLFVVALSAGLIILGTALGF
ncbi:MAG: hypothetical protein ACOC4Z_02705 [Patescibacteria group bacterium]